MTPDPTVSSLPALVSRFQNLQLPDYPTVTGPVLPFSAHGLGCFLGAAAWAWVLLVSFSGWGRWASVKLARVQPLPTSVSCTVGMAAVIFLGGWLNLMHLLSAPVLIGLVLLGLLLYAGLRGARPEAYGWAAFWRQATPVARILLAAGILLMLVRAAGTLRVGMFNNLDDGAAYMVFPHKLLAAHTFAFDPFSDRRVISSLGGAYLLQAMAIAGTSLASIGMADRTLGMVLLAVALFDLAVSFELLPWQIGLLEFLAFLAPQETINLSFVVLPTALLLAMVWLLLHAMQQDGVPVREAVLTGATGGAILSLKSTFLPCVGMFCVLPYFFALPQKRWSKALASAGLTLAACLLLLLPWMAAMRMNSGTWLFPLLGHGVDYSSYGWLPPQVHLFSRRTWIKIFLQAVALGILAMVLLLCRARGERVRLSLSILIAAAVAITAFNYKTGGDFIWRYNFPQFFCAVLVFYAALAGAYATAQPEARARLRLGFLCGVAAVGAMVFYYDAAGSNPRPFREMRMDSGDYRRGLRASLTGQAVASPQIAQEYAAAEAAIPVRARALENTAYPFLFSYRDRTIFVADWPGAASPKPGWYFEPDTNGLTRYLRAQSIRYVIYDYAYARWFDMEGCTAMAMPDRNSQELIALWHLGVVSHHQFDGLRERYRSLYDDGKMTVIDLEQPLTSTGREGNVWTLETPMETMCSVVWSRYQEHPL